MKLTNECDVLTDLYLRGDTLVAVRSCGTLLTVSLKSLKASTIVSPSTSNVNVSYEQLLEGGVQIGVLTSGVKRYTLYAPKAASTSYSNATVNAAGLMSKEDKVTLNTLAATMSLSYTPEVKTGTLLGVFKVGSKSINIYAPSQAATTYTLPAATATTLGGVKVGANLTVSSGTISLTKANVVAALGYTPIQDAGAVTEPMVPGDTAVDIYDAANVQNYSADFRLLTYTAPSNGYCSITGKLTVRVTDLTNGMDANSFSYLDEESNLGAAATIPVKAGHSIQFIWHKKAELTTTGADKFAIRFIPAT